MFLNYLSSVADSRQRFIKKHEAPSWRFSTLFEGALTARASAIAPEAKAEADKRSFFCFAARSGSTSFAFANLSPVSLRVESGRTSHPLHARELREGCVFHEVQGLQKHQEFCLDDQGHAHSRRPSLDCAVAVIDFGNPKNGSSSVGHSPTQ